MNSRDDTSAPAPQTQQGSAESQVASASASRTQDSQKSQDDLERIRQLRFIRRRIRMLQNQLARLIGVSRWDRERIVGNMLKHHVSDTVSYWLQLVLSVGIATLGVVLNSTGVVIGAMLISPLMGPIVGLGMGLAVGSPFLTLRSLVRVGASIGGVILMAALVTVMLPFHEVTPEISARTSPTVLDLAVAVFCALAAGFTTVRQSGDTAAAAAGVAIGIALVPPLCVSGFGLGTGQGSIFGGALLLFTANLFAILSISALLFLCLGFNAVHVERHEASEITSTGPIARIAARIRAVFGTRYGPLLRFLMPLLLIAAVYVPLRQALRKVAWQVEVSTEIETVLAEVAPAGNFVRNAVSVERDQVIIRLVMMGTPARAQQIEDDLRTRVAAFSGVIPEVDVVAVPDHASLSKVANAVSAPLPTHDIERPPDLLEVNQRVEELLGLKWPKEAGDLLSWNLHFDDQGQPVIELVHTGPPIGPLARPLVNDAVTSVLQTEVEVRDRPVLTGEWRADVKKFDAWIPQLIAALDTARSVPQLRACVTRGPDISLEQEPIRLAPRIPRPKTRREKRKQKDAPRPVARMVQPDPIPHPGVAVVDNVLAKMKLSKQISVQPGETWAVLVTRNECPKQAEPKQAPTAPNTAEQTPPQPDPEMPVEPDSPEPVDEVPDAVVDGE